MPSITDAKCVLVIGATAGIGRALALAIQALPSKPTVIVTGRRQQRLDELKQKGLETIQVDVDTDRTALKKFVDEAVGKYPEIDAIVFSAGIQHKFDFTKPNTVDLDVFGSELNTNYIALVTMITYFLPHLLKISGQGRPSFIVPISSVLAITPGPWVPLYCASKAALHSFSLSLHDQLKEKNVHVMEIMPPLVESELHDHQGTTANLSKHWMPLAEFTEAAMDGLKRGDATVPVGTGVEVWERFEKGKEEIAHATFAQIKAVQA